MEKLNLNRGKYLGETIDIKGVLSAIETAARQYGWRQEIFNKSDTFNFFALTRKGAVDAPNLYISSGMHGDEPAGPLAVLKLIEENKFPADWNIWICPCLNPHGFTLNTRENEKGIDLNRDYKNSKTPEVQAHIAWLEKQPSFDLSLCLHEDWESNGFYLLTQQGFSTHAHQITNDVRVVFPVDDSPRIEGFDADHGVIENNIDFTKVEKWPEAFYLLKEKHTHGEHYTFESCSDYTLGARVDALVAATQSAIKHLK